VLSVIDRALSPASGVNWSWNTPGVDYPMSNIELMHSEHVQVDDLDHLAEKGQSDNEDDSSSSNEYEKCG